MLYELTGCDDWEHRPPAGLLAPTGIVPRVGEAMWLSPALLRGRAETWDALNAPTVEFEVVAVRYEMTGNWQGDVKVKPVVTIRPAVSP